MHHLSSAGLAVLAASLSAQAFAGDFRLAFIDVGQGDAAVVISPSGCAAILDGGPTGSGPEIKAYLKSQGVTQVDFAVVSHYHADHMGGIDEVEAGTDAVTIGTVYDRGGSYSSTAYTQYANQFAGRRRTVTRGQIISLCSEVTFRVEAVNGNGLSTSNENGLSVAVKLSYGDFDALIGGDATAESPNLESTLLGTLGELELYKVHHHGSKYSSSQALLDELRPTVSVISVGVSNTYGHPTPEALARLDAVGSIVFQTEDPATNRVLGNVVVSSTSGQSYVVAQGGQSSAFASKGGGGGSGDTTAPSAPSSLEAFTSGTDGVDLSWNASTDATGVTGYRVFRSSGGAYQLAGTTQVTGFSESGLAAGTYSYRVTAVDAAGNESAASNTATVTLASSASLTITAPNGGETISGGSAYTVRWSATGVSTVRLEYSANGGGAWSTLASSVSASSGQYAWTVPTTASSQALIRISDTAGGASDVSDAVFTVTAPTPGKIIINEILANEPGASTSGEFIELVNVGGSAVNLGGWMLWDGSQNRHTFAANTVLNPGQAIVVFGSAAGIPAGVSNAVASSTGDLNLTNGGDTVSLRQTKSKKLDVFTYSSSLASQDGVSMNRNPDATAGAPFVLHTALSGLSASPGVRTSGAAF